ncbi:MAG: hypothetical protein KIT43_14595 [Bauldia sp.]|nr:hypothetical protein [Bauldia sp.]MCW5719120.1 hypothetical protein [Bauldia sp.]
MDGATGTEAALTAALDEAARAGRRLPSETQQAVDAAIDGGRHGPRLYGTALRYAFATGATPAIGQRLAKQWMLGLDALIEEGHLADAARATRLLAQAFPKTPWVQTWELVFDRLPPADDRREPFRDDPDAAVQLSALPGAPTLVVAFCGVAHRLGPPLSVIHRWLGRLDASILYLRDFRNAGFASGIEPVAANAPDTAAHILSIAREAGARRIATFGNSLGGYAALRYGPLLQADRVLAFIPATTGFADVPEDRRAEMVRAGWVDIVPLYAQPDAPTARVVFGAQNATDRAAALRLAGLPTVALEALPDWRSHDVFGALLRADRLHAVFEWMTSASPELDRGAKLAAEVDLSDPSPPSLINRAFGRLRRLVATRG